MSKISVCMATYNGEKYIHLQLGSILDQIGENDEIIISDDSSTDNTVNIIKTFNDKRIKLFENNRFFNPIHNFENALEKAKGDIIFLSDQDDIWLENKVKIMIGLLHQYDLVVSDCIIINENEDILNESFFRIRGSKKGLLNNLLKNSYMGCCMAFNRRILDIALPFPDNIPMHDMWIGMIGELYGKTYFCDQKLIKYRRHENSASPTCGPSPYTIIDKISFRANLLLRIAARLLERRTKNEV
ncbi:MAG: glycosyltransferase family 2 protein [Candidatus Methanoperedens sp.]|nr:glycosyltransferase family 2 protein [Candidatus Methanoperedens sp.]